MIEVEIHQQGLEAIRLGAPGQRLADGADPLAPSAEVTARERIPRARVEA
ncbi:hypothetical protein [Aeromonas dhakensis]|nr:hypothetical protein [Aeromonas dhakensis]